MPLEDSTKYDDVIDVRLSRDLANFAVDHLQRLIERYDRGNRQTMADAARLRSEDQTRYLQIIDTYRENYQRLLDAYVKGLDA